MKHIELLIDRYCQLYSAREQIEEACKIIIDCYSNNGKLLLCGNGGSAADCDHIVGELMKGFCKRRPLSDEKKSSLIELGEEGVLLSQKLQEALPAINLCAQPAVFTAFCNDVDPSLVFAQLAFGYAVKDDVFIGLSTSGNSKNVISAGIAAKAKKAKTIGMTGYNKCKMDDLFDCAIHVGETETYKIQELHLPIYHAICLEVEDYFFKL